MGHLVQGGAVDSRGGPVGPTVLPSTHDSILLCIDRLSGWMVACPTEKQGLTAGKAAHMMLEKGWDLLNIPYNIHSDMAGRMGIHQTYSQPYRPRANGRA